MVGWRTTRSSARYGPSSRGPRAALWDAEGKRPVIVGRSSTNVLRFTGTYDHPFKITTAGVTIHAPRLNIRTVATGADRSSPGRTAFFRVGSSSTSAQPGPGCYRKLIGRGHAHRGGRKLTLEPHAAGVPLQGVRAGEVEPLNRDVTVSHFTASTDDINKDRAAAG